MEKISSSKYLILLRGINVGGKNIIKMADLKSCCENLGFTDVATYIQSGNIIFKSVEKNIPSLINIIEKKLSQTFKYDAKAVIISFNELKFIVKNAPEFFGKDKDNFRYDVVFLKEPLTTKTAMKSIRIKEGVDTAYEGKKVIYFSRLISKASQSYLNKIIAMPIYKNMTIRNWNTTTKLFSLMEKKEK